MPHGILIRRSLLVGSLMKFMIATVIITIITPLFLTGSNGQPLASLNGLSLPFIQDLAKKFPVNGSSSTIGITAGNFPSNASNNAEPMIQSASGKTINTTDANKLLSQSPSISGNTTFYKWKNKEGVWQFTLTPPTDPSLDFTHITTDPNANVIQSLSKQDIASALGWKIPGSDNEVESEDDLDIDIPSIPFPSSIPADQIPQLIEQAKATRSLMENRNEVLNQL